MDAERVHFLLDSDALGYGHHTYANFILQKNTLNLVAMFCGRNTILAAVKYLLHFISSLLHRSSAGQKGDVSSFLFQTTSSDLQCQK